MPRPFPELWKRYPRAGEVFEQAEELALRPLFLYWRKKHLDAYLESCRSQGRRPGLHVGCASSPLQGWYNCDIRTMSRAVNFVDATDELPFDSGTFDFVFSEHFIEHLNFADGKKFFAEAYRVLKPGGIIRTATPDLHFVKGLLNSSTDTDRRYVEWLAKNFLPKGTPVDPAVVVNHLFFGWGHRFIYSSDFMGRVLREVGFRDVKSFKPGESTTAELQGIERHGHSVPKEFNELETFVVEATK